MRIGMEPMANGDLGNGPETAAPIGAATTTMFGTVLPLDDNNV